MPDDERLASAAAQFGRDSRKEFDRAVKELIALAFLYARAGADFLWDMDENLLREAHRICRNLSDTLAEKAMAIARGVVEDSIGNYEPEEDEGLVERFDMQGSHLLDLLEIWLALAFIHGIAQSELRVLISRYLSNPAASPLWRGLPKDVLAWGRGYPKNIPGQISAIGQTAIVTAYREAERKDAEAKGYAYYIRRRGSNYDCPTCDEMCGYPIPIDVPFEIPHPRCMCRAEYHFSDQQ